jgi:hypothetical protein
MVVDKPESPGRCFCCSAAGATARLFSFFNDDNDEWRWLSW